MQSLSELLPPIPLPPPLCFLSQSPFSPSRVSLALSEKVNKAWQSLGNASSSLSAGLRLSSWSPASGLAKYASNDYAMSPDFGLLAGSTVDAYAASREAVRSPASQLVANSSILLPASSLMCTNLCRQLGSCCLLGLPASGRGFDCAASQQPKV